MRTVASNLLKLHLRVDPIAKGTSSTNAGQRFKSSSDGTAITGTASNGGLIRITSATHGLVTGDYATVYGVGGTTVANNTAGNPAWIVTKIDANNVDLQGSTYAGAWTSGGTITGCFINSVDGARFTRQRLLEIYNEARMALFNALYETKGSDELSKYVYGAATTASIAITYSAPYKNIPKPSGFIRYIGGVDAAATPVRIIVLPNNLLAEVKNGTNPHLTTSASNLLAFEIGQNISIVGNYGTTPASIDYYGITNWTWVTDVLPVTTVETFSPDIEPILIELACAIADEQSNADVLSLAKTLLNKKES